MDIKQTEQFLNQALLITEERGFQGLEKIISSEYYTFLEQIGKWEKIMGQKQTLKERVELTNLDRLIDIMIQKKIYRRKEEIVEYASIASKLAEKWEEEMY